MSPRELVLRTLRREPCPRFPRGEICITPGFVEGLLGRPCRGPADRAEAAAVLGLDLVVVEADPAGVDRAAEEIRWWRRATDPLVAALVPGPFQGALSRVPLWELCRLVLRAPGRAAGLLGSAARDLEAAAGACVLAGAEAVVVADDIAGTDRLLLSPRVLRRLVLPALRKAVARVRRGGVPVIYHSDGNIRPVLPDIAALGVDGLHPLQASAGMGIGEVKRRHGAHLVLWGNLELEAHPPPCPGELVHRAARLVREAAPGGGFIFGTSSGLTDHTPPAAAAAVAAEKSGQA